MRPPGQRGHPRSEAAVLEGREDRTGKTQKPGSGERRAPSHREGRRPPGKRARERHPSRQSLPKKARFCATHYSPWAATEACLSPWPEIGRRTRSPGGNGPRWPRCAPRGLPGGPGPLRVRGEDRHQGRGPGDDAGTLAGPGSLPAGPGVAGLLEGSSSCFPRISEQNAHEEESHRARSSPS